MCPSLLMKLGWWKLSWSNLLWPWRINDEYVPYVEGTLCHGNDAWESLCWHWNICLQVRAWDGRSSRIRHHQCMPCQIVAMETEEHLPVISYGWLHMTRANIGLLEHILMLAIAIKALSSGLTRYIYPIPFASFFSILFLFHLISHLHKISKIWRAGSFPASDRLCLIKVLNIMCSPETLPGDTTVHDVMKWQLVSEGGDPSSQSNFPRTAPCVPISTKCFLCNAIIVQLQVCMPKKKLDEPHESHPSHGKHDWHVSYSNVVTALPCKPGLGNLELEGSWSSRSD